MSKERSPLRKAQALWGRCGPSWSLSRLEYRAWWGTGDTLVVTTASGRWTVEDCECHPLGIRLYEYLAL